MIIDRLRNLSSLPKITCLMPTYNRVRQTPEGDIQATILDEAVESFLRQDYPNRELLILNDTPRQPLVVDVNLEARELDPAQVSIRVINFSSRYDSLGSKCNVGIHEARGAYVTRWDDDDISLPNRLALAMDKAIVHEQFHFPLVIVQGWFYEPVAGELVPQLGTYGFTSDLVSTQLAKRVAYQATSRCDEDQRFRYDLQAAAPQHQIFLPTLDELHYIYRWGSTGHEHFSGHGGNVPFEKIGQSSVIQTQYRIQPAWRKDYAAYAEAAREAYRAGHKTYKE